MSNGMVSISDKKYTTVKSDYCINFSNPSVIRSLESGPENVSISETYDYLTVKEIEDMPMLKTISFIGVVHTIGPCVDIHLKNGTMKQ
jgi:hypothetical protein